MDVAAHQVADEVVESAMQQGCAGLTLPAPGAVAIDGQRDL